MQHSDDMLISQWYVYTRYLLPEFHIIYRMKCVWQCHTQCSVNYCKAGVKLFHLQLQTSYLIYRSKASTCSCFLMLPILSLHIKLNITCNSYLQWWWVRSRHWQRKRGPCSGRRASTLVGNGRCVAKKVLRVLASLPKFRLLLDNVGVIRTRVGADWEYFLQVAHFLSAFLLIIVQQAAPDDSSPLTPPKQ